MYQIARREVFSENTFLWEVLAPDVAAAAQPGHFVMLRLNENGERIPLTVADFDRERGTVPLWFKRWARPPGRCATIFSKATVLTTLSDHWVCLSTSKKSVMWCWSAGAWAWHPSFRNCEPSRKRATAPPVSSVFAARNSC